MPPVEIRHDVGDLANVIRAAKARTIAIDGCDAAAKTTLANQLGDFLDCSVIDVDDYLHKNQGSFIAALKIDELGTAVKAVEVSDEGLIISGVCMLDLLRRVETSVDLIVYVERRSKHDIPGDLDILKCEDEEFSIPERVRLHALKHELCQYHREFKPRSRADVVFVPEMSHGSPRPIQSDERYGQRIRRPPRFELLQVVYVRDAHPGLGLVKGECGTIVETFEKPDEAYLVEFINDDGSTKTEAAFALDQLSSAPPPP